MIINPVVRGDAPDPSVCRVGRDFFLATSTLDFWPGIPIRHSTDLVHWTVIGHAVTRTAQYRRDGVPGELRLYAPTLRHHDGRFYLVCTNTAPGQGNFVITADDPAGPWSDAIWIDSDGFDPSLSFDEGRSFYTRRTVVPGKEGSGPVVQAEIDLSTGGLLSRARPITPGPEGYRSNDIEGPHLHRIGDWWYLFAAEGGTWKGHMVVVARARTPWGPFEGSPRNPVLTHRHRVGHPIQSTGHVDVVDDAEGGWWAVFLGTRHDGPAPWHHLGREVFLAPLTWDEGWPVIGDDGTVELNHVSPQALPLGTGGWPSPATPWTAGWSTRGGPLDGLLIEDLGHDDGARITVPGNTAGQDDSTGAGAVFLRQCDFLAAFGATVDHVPSAPATSGISVYATPAHHYDLMVTQDGDQRLAIFRRRVADLITQTTTALHGQGPVRLRVAADAQDYRFSVSDDPSGGWREIGRGAVSLLSSETSLSYAGVRFAVVAHHLATTFTHVLATSRSSAS